jgi:hypothetical protein
MKRSESEAFAKRVCHYYKNVTNCNKKETVWHFAVEGKPKSTIYGILKRLEENNDTKYKPIPGKPPSQCTPKMIR